MFTVTSTQILITVCIREILYGVGSLKSLTMILILILGLTGIVPEEQTGSRISLNHTTLGAAFAQSSDVNSNNTSNQYVGPIPEDNSTALFPGDNGTGPIPEGDLTPPADNLTASLLQDNNTNSTGGNQSGTYPSVIANEDEKTAIQNSVQIIQQLQQNIDLLQKPLQSILSDLQTGQYYGPIEGGDSVTNSYEISFTGSAVSKDSVNASSVSGQIFLQNMITGDSVIKFKAVGGHIDIGSISYDLAFGKARVTYSSEGVKDSMTIIAIATDSTGNPGTIRILAQISSPLEGNYGLTPIPVTIQSPESQVNGIWSLSGTGKLTLVQS